MPNWCFNGLTIEGNPDLVNDLVKQLNKPFVMLHDSWNMETGWGLQVNSIGDNEHKIAVINWKERTFSLHAEDDHRNLDNKVLGMKNEAIFTMDLSAFCEKYALEQLLAI